MKGPTRRELVFATASAGMAGAAALVLKRSHPVLQSLESAALANSAPAPFQPNLLMLSDSEYAAVSAVCERLFPRDDTPGAHDLGVALYIDKALAGDPPPGWGDGLLTSVARLDAESYRRHAVPFWRAKPADQDALIGAWSAEAEGDRPLFVKHLVVATLEGVLGDPTHGGNRNGEGWKSMGLRPDPFSPSLVRRP
jgi:gluconate 2-dehydrogenase gamma chain